jgi:hypothetical protein
MNNYDEINNNVLYFIFNVIDDDTFMNLVNLFNIQHDEVKYLLLLAIKNKNVKFVIEFGDYGFKLDIFSGAEIHKLLYHSTPEILLVLRNNYRLTKDHFKRLDGKLILDFQSISNNDPSLLKTLKESFRISKDDINILEFVKNVENNNDLVVKELREVFQYKAEDIKNIEKKLIKISVKNNNIKIIRDLVINFNIDKKLVKNIIKKNIEEKEDLLQSVTLWDTKKLPTLQKINLLSLTKLIVNNIEIPDSCESSIPSPSTPLKNILRCKTNSFELEKIPKYDSNFSRNNSNYLDGNIEEKLSITSFNSDVTIDLTSISEKDDIANFMV